MFNQLQDRLSSAVKTLKGQGKISEKNVKNAIRDVRRALLEADVNLMVVRSFINKVQEKAIGEKVLKSISPSQQFIKIIYDEMVDFLGEDNSSIEYSQSGLTVITVAGLPGVGKTTTCAKLASFLKNKQHKTPMLIAADINRPAAIEQLETLGKNINIPVFFLIETIKMLLILLKQESLKQKKINLIWLLLIQLVGFMLMML